MENTEILKRAEKYIELEHDDYFRNQVEALIKEDNAGELYDRFYKDLEFGTGGLRGLIGGGFNRMNPLIVQRATQGLANYIKENVDSNIISVSCEKCRDMKDKCWTSDCHFRACAEDQGLNYCFECEDFVCDKLAEFGKQAPNHAKTIENMKNMKVMGIDKWIASQPEVKFCP